MDIPEKIYLFESRSSDGLSSKWLQQRLEDTDIEYIRTDVFIEKAYKKLEKCMYDNLMFQGRLHRKEVIEMFIEGFKKAIEE